MYIHILYYNWVEFMALPSTFSCAVFDPYSPCTVQMTGPDLLRVTLWMMKSTQLVSPVEQNTAENSPGDEVMLLSTITVSTRSPWTFQVMTVHGPSTVALKRTWEPCSTVEVSGSSWNCCRNTKHRELICKSSAIGTFISVKSSQFTSCWHSFTFWLWHESDFQQYFSRNSHHW